MMRVELAVYGDRGGGHDLLESSLPERGLPPGLGQKVDRPAGLDAVWSPFWGCGPVGDWWSLWWGEEDLSASRAGMVRSQVALVPLDQIGRLSRLELLVGVARSRHTCLLEALSLDEGMPGEPNEAPGLGSLAPLLLGAPEPLRVFLGTEAALEGACSLWSRLWPAARAGFACRVVLGPEQVDRSDEVCFIVAPASTRPRWRGCRLVDPNQPPSLAQSEAESWLRGSAAPGIEALLRLVGDVLPSEIGALSKLERLAEAARLLGAGGGVDDAIRGLRALQEIRSVAGRLPDRCAAIRDAIATGLEAADLGPLLALSNVHAEILPQGVEALSRAVAARVGVLLPEATDDEALKLLERQVAPRFQPWWRSAVQEGLRPRLVAPSDTWASALWRWWQARIDAVDWTETLLGDGQAAERSLVQVAPRDLGEALAVRARSLAVARGWPELYARILLALEGPENLFTTLRAFSHSPERGIPVLLRARPVETSLRTALSLEWDALTDAVAALTLRSPEVLAALDPRARGWRTLWASRVRQGGGAWDGLTEPERLFHDLIDQAARGDADAATLAERLADGKHGHMLRAPDRETRWGQLPPGLRDLLLQTTADAWLQAAEAGTEDADTPESALANALLAAARARLSRPGAPGRLVARCLEALPEARSDEVLAWIRGMRAPMALEVAERAGRALVSREDQDVARALYDDRERRPDLLLLLRSCAALLTWVQRLLLSPLWVAPPTPDLQRAVAELGSRLMPSGPTESLWSEADLDASRLSREATGEARWEHAVQQALREAGQDGLWAVVKALRARYPMNPEIEQLWRRSHGRG